MLPVRGRASLALAERCVSSLPPPVTTGGDLGPGILAILCGSIRIVVSSRLPLKGALMNLFSPTTQPTPPSKYRSLWLSSVCFALGALLLATTLPTAAAAEEGLSQEKKGKKPEREINLDVIESKSRTVLLEPYDGWALDFELRAEESRLLGFAMPVLVGDMFPRLGTPSSLVFEDPDGCPSFVSEDVQQTHIDGLATGGGLYPDCVEPLAPPWPRDEVMVDFEAGWNLPEPSDGLCVGSPSSRPEGCAPTYTVSDGDYQEFGPSVGSTTDDYGYGALSRLPGLVLVADVGPSIVLDEDFNRGEILECRNLAGFIQSVGVEYRGSKDTTNLRTHMLVPRGLFLRSSSTTTTSTMTVMVTAIAMIPSTASTEGPFNASRLSSPHPSPTSKS